MMEGNNNVRFSVNYSGIIRKTFNTNEMARQIDVTYNLREGARNFKDSCKIVLVSSSIEANMFPHQARVVFKVHAKFFGADYHLIPSSHPEVSKNQEQKNITVIMRTYYLHRKPLQR